MPQAMDVAEKKSTKCACVQMFICVWVCAHTFSWNTSNTQTQHINSSNQIIRCKVMSCHDSSRCSIVSVVTKQKDAATPQSAFGK